MIFAGLVLKGKVVALQTLPVRALLWSQFARGSRLWCSKATWRWEGSVPAAGPHS